MSEHPRITRHYENVVVVRFGDEAPFEVITPARRPIRRQRDWWSEVSFGLLLLVTLWACLFSCGPRHTSRALATPTMTACSAKPVASEPKAMPSSEAQVASFIPRIFICHRLT